MRAEIFFLLVFVGIMPAHGAGGDETVKTEAEIIQEGASMPSMELLEFLGAWETDDGEWVDPAILDDTGLPNQESSDE